MENPNSDYMLMNLSTKENYMLKGTLNPFAVFCAFSMFITFNTAHAGGVVYDVVESKRMFEIFFGNDVEKKILKKGKCTLSVVDANAEDKNMRALFNLSTSSDGKPYMPFCSILLNTAARAVDKNQEVELGLYRHKTDFLGTVKSLFKGNIVKITLDGEIKADIESKVADKKIVKINADFLRANRAEILPAFDSCVTLLGKGIWPNGFSQNEKANYSRIRKSIAALSPKDTTASDDLKISDVTRGAVKEVQPSSGQAPSDRNVTTSK